MAITVNGIINTASYGAVDNSGALTHAVGGTSQSNALLVMEVAYTSPSTTAKPILGVTDSQGNTWALYHRETANSGWNTGQTINGAQKSFTTDIWYTKAATVGTTIDITIDHGAGNTIDAAAVFFSPKFLGYDATNPFDTHASLPAVTRGNSSTAETITGISTSTTNIYPFWAIGIWGTNLNLSNVSFDGVFRDDQDNKQKNQSEPARIQGAYGPAATGPYSGVTYSSPTSADNFFAIGFALTADSTPPSSPPVSRVMIIG